ncbi:MAG: hypothetical protein HOA57_03755 [Candidatus Magasanikbacteria bacterium]|jgi:hypothetical protein|nr:hypothetical protein [Candidatus Magasanikbacteria bacterium]MBT4315350.1 hypothetical protein [Candidatus Magasanikbacteria bacterium]MBT4547223.1 hypothetical protein [Candidatus Magasanikbacteria bacterium]MBT6819463.1 hypothetical protein [Candidatus Magasanikbacteria bacterium]
MKRWLYEESSYAVLVRENACIQGGGPEHVNKRLKMYFFNYFIFMRDLRTGQNRQETSDPNLSENKKDLTSFKDDLGGLLQQENFDQDIRRSDAHSRTQKAFVGSVLRKIKDKDIVRNAMLEVFQAEYPQMSSEEVEEKVDFIIRVVSK